MDQCHFGHKGLLSQLCANIVLGLLIDIIDLSIYTSSQGPQQWPTSRTAIIIKLIWQ
jgi:hypothetical protein